MAELRALFDTLGLTPVETVLQSGNAVFEGSGGAGAKLESTLEAAAEEHLGLETAFFVRSAAEWDAAIRGNPFPQEARDAPSKLAVAFLKRAPSAAALASLQQSIRGRERLAAKGKQAYVVYPDGMGRSRLTAVALEKALGGPATARNWNTVRKLQDAVGAGPGAC